MKKLQEERSEELSSSSVYDGVVSNKDFSYPANRQKYARIVGSTLVTTLVKIFHELGFTVHVNPLQANGVDISVFHQGKLVCVMEITNWSIVSYCDSKRFENIVQNLSHFNCPRALVVAYRSNLGNFKDRLREYGVDIIEIGFQLLPPKYYNWFKKRDMHYDKKPLIPAVYEQIKSQISAYVYILVPVNKGYFEKIRLNLGDKNAKSGFVACHGSYKYYASDKPVKRKLHEYRDVSIEELLKAIGEEEAHLLDLEEKTPNTTDALSKYQLLTVILKTKLRLTRLRHFLHSRLSSRYNAEYKQLLNNLRKQQQRR